MCRQGFLVYGYADPKHLYAVAFQRGKMTLMLNSSKYANHPSLASLY